jgi:hypothetical protein
MSASIDSFWQDGGSALLERAARSLATDERVCASALIALHHQRGWSMIVLAEWLETTPQQVLGLALCQRPDPAAVDFRSMVHQLAEYVSCNVQCLAELLSQPLPRAAAAPASPPLP